MVSLVTHFPQTLSRLLLYLYPGEGNGTPLQYSCLEHPMDGGAWWAAVHGVAQSRTRLSGLAAAVAAVVVYNIYITSCVCENLENYIPKSHT